MGAYLTTIVFKDAPKLKYEYSYDERYGYPHHIYVVAFQFFMKFVFIRFHMGRVHKRNVRVH